MLTSTYILLYIHSLTHTTTMNAIKSDFSGGFTRHVFFLCRPVVKLLTRRRPKRPPRRRLKIFHHRPPRVHITPPISDFEKLLGQSKI